jgi:hypothetical protein
MLTSLSTDLAPMRWRSGEGFPLTSKASSFLTTFEVASIAYNWLGSNA